MAREIVLGVSWPQAPAAYGSHKVKLDGNALTARLFPPPIAELIELDDPPNARTWHIFENSSLLPRSPFLDFGGRPAPDSFHHFRNVSVSYFLARAVPRFLPILRGNSRTSSPGASQTHQAGRTHALLDAFAVTVAVRSINGRPRIPGLRGLQSTRAVSAYPPTESPVSLIEVV